MTATFAVSASGGSAFPHYWEEVVGSCHAVMGLRDDWRRQLARAHDELGFRAVRFHGILDDAMSVCISAFGAPPRLSFFNVDPVYDFIIAIGMRPFVELGFMPTALASGPQTCFAYRANVTPPADMAAWEDLVRQFVTHLVERYGIDEVRTWPFEVWNEPNLPFFFTGTREDYFALYDAAARAVNAVDPSIRIGGPATSFNAWIPEMIEHCRTAGVPLNFVSTHHYATDDPLWSFDSLTTEEFFEQVVKHIRIRERGALTRMAAKAREDAGDLPLYYTEWSTSALPGDPYRDTPASAALVAKALADNAGLVDGYAYWTFSDLFEEGGQASEAFHGGFGLQTIHGIAKPVYRVFELFHTLGTTRLPVAGQHDTVGIIATGGERRVDLVAWNHDIPGAPLDEVMVEVALPREMHDAAVSTVRVDADHANARGAWDAMGAPEYPTRGELDALEQASRLVDEPLEIAHGARGPVVRFSMPAHSVAAIRLTTGEESAA